MPKKATMSREEYRALEQKTVVKANELITHTTFSLTAQQQKIVLYLIAQVRPTDEDFREYEFSIQDFSRACGLDRAGGRQYEQLMEVLEALADSKIRYNGSAWIPVGEGWKTMLRWIEKPYINPEDGKIRIRLDRDMRPFLLHLREHFTQYELLWTLQFTGRYTIRLYELAKARQYDKLRPVEISLSLDYLREHLDAGSYARWADLRRRVIDPAVAEINAKSDMQISYTTTKGAHGTDALRLRIETKGSMERLALYANLERDYNLDQLSMFDRPQDAPTATRGRYEDTRLPSAADEGPTAPPGREPAKSLPREI